MHLIGFTGFERFAMFLLAIEGKKKKVENYFAILVVLLSFKGYSLLFVKLTSFLFGKK